MVSLFGLLLIDGVILVKSKFKFELKINYFATNYSVCCKVKKCVLFNLKVNVIFIYKEKQNIHGAGWFFM